MAHMKTYQPYTICQFLPQIENIPHPWPALCMNYYLIIIIVCLLLFRLLNYHSSGFKYRASSFPIGTVLTLYNLRMYRRISIKTRIFAKST